MYKHSCMFCFVLFCFEIFFLFLNLFLIYLFIFFPALQTMLYNVYIRKNAIFKHTEYNLRFCLDFTAWRCSLLSGKNMLYESAELGLALLMLRLLSSKAQGCKDFLKIIETLSCWYSLGSSRWVLSDENPCVRVSVIFQVLCIISYGPD